MMERTVSESYRGPHAVFTNEELLAIRSRCALLVGLNPILASVVKKIDTTLNSDSKFREEDS